MNPEHKGLSLHVVPPAAGGGPVTDPVCGMRVEPQRAAGSFGFEGTTYYFCSTHCLERFRAEPRTFLEHGPRGMGGGVPPSPQPLFPEGRRADATQAEYYCPMDPEVVSDRPGTCPRCGMALERRQPSLEEGPDLQLRDMERRFWVGVTLGIPLLALAMVPMFWHIEVRGLDELNQPIQAILCTAIVVYCGWPVWQR